MFVSLFNSTLSTIHYKMNYLQSERNYTILNSIFRILQQNGLKGTENLSLLVDKTINKTGWTSVLLDAYDARAVPVYTSEFITRINTAHHQELTQINSTRKKLIDHLEKEISYRKKSITDACNEMRPMYARVKASQSAHIAARSVYLSFVTLVVKYMCTNSYLVFISHPPL